MWRKGPADKPVLCNPCGARWITKKTLEGYLPQSAGGRKASTSKRSRAAAGTTSSSARQKKPREQRKPPAAPRESETLVLSSKRVRRVPQKYIDSSNGGAKTTKPKRKGLKIELVDKGMKSMDRIPSPQKPAKKRHTVRNLFVDDLASPRTTLPPKKKKHDVLLSFPYMKRTVLQSFESPLCFIDLKEIVKESTLEDFSEEDKCVLAALLPNIDVEKTADGAEKKLDFSKAFKSEAFQSALANYQNLLKSGSFDPEFPAANLRMVDHFNRLTKEVNLAKWNVEAPQVGGTSRRRRAANTKEFSFALQEVLMKVEPKSKVETPVRTEIAS